MTSSAKLIPGFCGSPLRASGISIDSGQATVRARLLAEQSPAIAEVEAQVAVPAGGRACNKISVDDILRRDQPLIERVSENAGFGEGHRGTVRASEGNQPSHKCWISC